MLARRLLYISKLLKHYKSKSTSEEGRVWSVLYMYVKPKFYYGTWMVSAVVLGYWCSLCKVHSQNPLLSCFLPNAICRFEYMVLISVCLSFHLVCVTFLGRFYQGLNNLNVEFTPASVEKELLKACKEAKGKENRFVSNVDSSQTLWDNKSVPCGRRMEMTSWMSLNIYVGTV